MPAFATKTSILPKSSTTWSILFSTASACSTATLYALVLTPNSFASSSARAMAASLELYHKATSPPASAIADATARPIPSAAPLTTVTLPFIWNCSRTLEGTIGNGFGNPGRATPASSMVIDILKRRIGRELGTVRSIWRTKLKAMKCVSTLYCKIQASNVWRLGFRCGARSGESDKKGPNMLDFVISWQRTQSGKGPIARETFFPLRLSSWN